MEQMDRLWPGGPVFYYDDALFKPGTDAFLLGAFARPRAGDRVCDLGAGTGLIGLLLLAHVHRRRQRRPASGQLSGFRRPRSAWRSKRRRPTD